MSTSWCFGTQWQTLVKQVRLWPPSTEASCESRMGAPSRLSPSVLARRKLARSHKIQECGLSSPIVTSPCMACSRRHHRWGLDRIDQNDLSLNSTFSYPYTGSGVHLYILDSGLNASHTDVQGRVGNGYSAVGGGTTDCLGHGTHVTTIAAGTVYGVAKAATVHPVRVFACSDETTTENILDGIDWIADNRVLPAVANMSVGGGASSAIDGAVDGLANNRGVSVAVSAGNDGVSACGQSPARAASVITVAASSINDSRWVAGSNASNVGPCVELFAPGGSILAGWIGGSSATETLSGTSMASPHVAGYAAQYLEAFPSAIPQEVLSAVAGNATLDRLSNIGTGSPNRLLFMGFGRGMTSALSGPTTVTGNPWVPTNYQYSASGQGGPGAYTYQWVRRPCGSGSANAGTTSTITIGVQTGTPDFFLQVTISSGTFSASSLIFVNNTTWNPGLIQCLAPGVGEGGW